MTLPTLLFTLLFLIWKRKSRPDSKFPVLSFVPTQSNHCLTEYMQSIYLVDLVTLSGITVTEKEVDSCVLLGEPQIAKVSFLGLNDESAINAVSSLTLAAPLPFDSSLQFCSFIKGWVKAVSLEGPPNIYV